ncbi:MAG TPA: hypothetical protein VIJ04_21110 [Xanthobacteraceae bacterium]
MKRPWDAIVWWEIQRIPYNIALAFAGAVSIAVVFLVGSRSAVFSAANPLGLIIGIVLYGIGANLFYTLGWISELLWSGGDTTRTEPFRKRVFRIGLIASFVITLLPAVLIPTFWLIFGF